jgi:hypothetical protein
VKVGGLYVLAAAAVLVTAPASAQAQTPAPYPPPGNPTPPQYNSFANSPYVGTDGVRTCLSVGPAAGAIRVGPQRLYLQDKKGAIFRLDLAEPCEALDGAEAISLRGAGLDACAGDLVTMVVRTAAGARFCAFSALVRPTKAEVTKLVGANPGGGSR